MESAKHRSLLRLTACVLLLRAAWGWGKRDDLPLPNLWYQSPVECGVVGRMPRQLSAKSSFGDGSAARKFVETWAEHESLMLGGGAMHFLMA